MREWFVRLVDWVRRDRLDRELTEELRFHQAHVERDARASGETPGEAVWMARRRLGNVTRVRESVRERWSVPWLDHLMQDLRYAVRGLRRSPAFTVSVVLTLGLGIGANAAMFAVIDRLMFRPHAYLRDPSSVHRVYLQLTDRDREVTREGFEYPRYQDLRRWTSSFSAAAAYYHGTHAVGRGAESRERPVAAVTASFFGFFDAPPTLGRYFVESEDRPPVGANVVVLDHGFWRTSYGGRNVLGEALRIGEADYTIIGVAPRGFAGVSERQPPVAYVPVAAFAANDGGRGASRFYVDYSWGWLDMMVRRKPGVSMSAANADLSGAHVRSWDAERSMRGSLPPAEAVHPRAVAASLRAAAGPNRSLEAKTLVWVGGVAVSVFLIACANVANLFLARALRRRREMALRVALGVGRGRLVAQSLTESAALALTGGVIGIAVAQWGGLTLGRLFVGDASSIDVLTDARTLAVAVIAILCAAATTGIAPLLIVARGGVASTLKLGPREGTHQRSPLRSALLVTQAALSMTLLIGAGLFVQSLSHARQARLGYDADRVLMAIRSLRGTDMSEADRMRHAERLLETAQSIPGVERAAWVASVPFWLTSTTRFFVEGIDSVARLGEFTYQQATTDYFATMGTRIVRGRGFLPSDRPGAPRVVVVSQSMANVLWPGVNPLGKCMRLGSDTMPCTSVVGVAEDVAHNSLTDEKRYRYYLPIDQFRPQNGYAVLLRMRDAPTQAVDRVRAALQAVMPGESYVTVRPLSDLVDGERRSWRMGATMFVALGILALAVASVGLYSVIAYSVAQRMHELGVRVALGARAGDIVRLVVGQGVRFAVTGATAGGILAFLAARWVQPLLYEQSATDARVYGLVGAVLLLVAMVASAIPARRATRVDPNVVLRAE